MGIARDLYLAWARARDGRQRRPRYTLFTHRLQTFPRPERRALADPPPIVTIATPCRDVAGLIDRYGALIRGLDYPKDHIHWRLLEGDSSDDTAVAAQQLLDGTQGYRSTGLIRLHLGNEQTRATRHDADLQRARRAAIAACRNRLLDVARATDAEYVLFADADMSDVPPDALRRALEWNAPVLAANCLRHKGDQTYDLNSFRYTAPVSDRSARRFLRDGLYQPPPGYFRHYPSADNGRPVEQLSCVGGTFLLIRRDVIDAGARFPETPYQLHIETEGFALHAADLGYGSFMDPRLIVRHTP